MPRRLEEYVSENRDRARRLDSRFVHVSNRPRSDLTFARNEIRVDVTLEIYTRPLNTALISGHPNAAHGSARGVSGDRRGSWSKVGATTQTKVWARGGRQALRDALDGQQGALAEGAVGTGQTDASVSDTSLNTSQARRWAWGVKDSTAVTRARCIFGPAAHDTEDLYEWALFDGRGTLMARATTDAISPDLEQEVKLAMLLEVSGEGAGNSVITEKGEEAVADSLRANSETVGLDKVAMGTGTSEFTTSKTALTSEEYRKTAGRDLGTETLKAKMWTAANEPNSQPVDLSEVAVFTNDGRMVWATTFEPREKNDTYAFTTSVGFRSV